MQTLRAAGEWGIGLSRGGTNGQGKAKEQRASRKRQTESRFENGAAAP
jgi:hypothetical protein